MENCLRTLKQCACARVCNVRKCKVSAIPCTCLYPFQFPYLAHALFWLHVTRTRKTGVSINTRASYIKGAGHTLQISSSNAGELRCLLLAVLLLPTWPTARTPPALLQTRKRPLVNQMNEKRNFVVRWRQVQQAPLLLQKDASRMMPY